MVIERVYFNYTLYSAVYNTTEVPYLVSNKILENSTLHECATKTLLASFKFRAIEIFDGSDVPQKIDEIVNSDKISVRKGVIISSNIGLYIFLL